MIDPRSTPVAYRVERWLRRNVLAAATTAVLIAVVLTPVLVLTAGARRTASLSERYAAANPSDFDVDFIQPWGVPLTAEIAALPAVDQIRASSFMFGGLIPVAAGEDGDLVEALTFVGDSNVSDGPLIAGRGADPARPDEFAASARFAALGPFEVGDRFTLVTVSAEAASAGGFENDPDGPAVEATLVGIWQDTPAEALNDPEFTAVAVFPSSLLELGSIGLAATVGQIEMVPGADVAELRHQLDTIDGGGSQISVEPHQIVPAEVDDAIGVRTIGFTVLASIVALTALIVMALLLVRQFRVDDADRPVLAALGYTRRQTALEPVARAGPAVIAGAGTAAIAAWLLSGRFPYGFGATLEPDPGRRFDPLVHVAGAALTVGVVLLLLGALVGREATRWKPQRALDIAARRAPTVASSAATRLAFGRDRRTGSTNGSLVGVAAVLAVTIAALVVGSSLHALLHAPARWGDGWDLGIGQGGEELPPGFAETLAGSDLVAAVTLFGTTEVQSGQGTVPVVAFDATKGTELPELLDGRLPAAAREVAISTPASRRLGIGVGDRFQMRTDAGRDDLLVVGIVVVPGVDGVEAGDPSVLVNLAGYHAIDPQGGLSTAGVYLAEDAPDNAAELLAADLGAQFAESFGSFSTPPRVLHLRLVEDIPTLVAAVVGALVAISAIHLLVTAVRRRRADREVFLALGATPRWLRHVVGWQVTLLVVAAGAIGGFAGIVLGRLVFDPFPERIGASPGVRLPWGWLGVSVAALLATAGLVAATVGRQRRAPTSLSRE